MYVNLICLEFLGKKKIVLLLDAESCHLPHIQPVSFQVAVTGGGGGGGGGGL
jgi:hypothetical protein